LQSNITLLNFKWRQGFFGRVSSDVPQRVHAAIFSSVRTAVPTAFSLFHSIFPPINKKAPASLAMLPWECPPSQLPLLRPSITTLSTLPALHCRHDGNFGRLLRCHHGELRQTRELRKLRLSLLFRCASLRFLRWTLA
jgi:hypothetical protein